MTLHPRPAVVCCIRDRDALKRVRLVLEAEDVLDELVSSD